MTFASDIQYWVTMVLLAIVAATFLYQLYFYIRYMAGVQRRVRHQAKQRFRWRVNKAQTDEEAAEEEPKGVTVVVCAKNEADNLEDFLQAILSQKYPRYEVIVVNDASEDNTQVVLDHYAQRFPQLRLSFVPTNAWVRSSKKLAITLAIKAAKYDYLLLTDADCRPETNTWIAEMMRGFDNPQTEVVLGYGGYFEEDTCIGRRIKYDTVFNAMQYLGMAMSRHPYMGVGRNLAYKKSTFFEKGGFSGLLNMRSGDDDLFVNKVANRTNTEVVLTPGSYTWSVPKRSYRDWRIQKYRHLSVAPCYSLMTKLRLGIEPLVRGLFYLSLILTGVAVYLGYAHLYLAFLAAGLFVIRLVLQVCMMNRGMRIFGVRPLGLRVLWYDIVMPLSNLGMLFKHAFCKKKEIKWN